MKRLRERCCPIHNIWLQMDPMGGSEEEGPVCWAAFCPRKDCNFWMYAYDEMGRGPWDVPERFSHLLAPDFAAPNEPVRIEPSEKYEWELAEFRARIKAIDWLSKLNLSS